MMLFTKQKLLLLSFLVIAFFSASGFANNNIRFTGVKTKVVYNDPTKITATSATSDQVISQKYHANLDVHNISMNFQSIPIRVALKLITNEVGLNLVVSSSVDGDVTLKLNNLPWQEALDVILKTHGLTKYRIGNTMVVAPITQYASEKQAVLAAEKQIASLVPLKSNLIKLHFAQASDMAGVLKSGDHSLLSDRGQVSVDKRTNSLWVQDTPQNIQEIRSLVRKLDTPVKQVLIEARIVNMDDSRAKEMGVRFGISSGRNLSGTLQGATELQQGTSLADIELTKRLNFDATQNLSSALFKQPASLGLATTRIFGNYMLDLELQAMQEEQVINIIASPRLIISHQQSGIIETGTEISYEEKTSSGATNSVYKKAVLSLKVTPLITAHNKIMLNLEVTDDKPSTKSYPGSTGTAIEAQHMATQVWLENGHTIVLGGIYQRTKSNLVQRVPFLSDIPLVGNLFKYKQQKDDRQELIIFITPKIINPLS
jgi:type IV pilus assembly protein PilQ